MPAQPVDATPSKLVALSKGGVYDRTEAESAFWPLDEMTGESMHNPFSTFRKDFAEMYEVVKSVITVHRRLYKVEILRDYPAPQLFKVHFSIQERLIH